MFNKIAQSSWRWKIILIMSENFVGMRNKPSLCCIQNSHSKIGYIGLRDTWKMNLSVSAVKTVGSIFWETLWI